MLCFNFTVDGYSLIFYDVQILSTFLVLGNGHKLKEYLVFSFIYSQKEYFCFSPPGGGVLFQGV